MNNITNLKTIGQNSVNHLLDLGKQQPEEVKTWGVTAAGAVAGSLILNAGAQGLLSVLSVLASLPVSLTVGAIGGGALGWMVAQQRKEMERTNGQGVPSLEAQSSEDVQEIVVEAIAPDVVADAVVEESVETSNLISEALLAVETGETESRIAEESPALEGVVTPESTDMPQNSVEAVMTESPTDSATDRLETISGIGPVFASHLRSAGIYTFAQLAELSPEQLHTIMSITRGGKMIDADHWIEQAKQLRRFQNINSSNEIA